VNHLNHILDQIQRLEETTHALAEAAINSKNVVVNNMDL